MYRPKELSGAQSAPTATIPVQGYTKEERERIREALGRQLGPEFISKRRGHGASSVQYLEGWKAINLANEIFGPMGWCSELRGFQVDYIDGKEGSISLGLSCNVRVVLKDGTYHEDIGYGSIDNCRTKSMAFDKCKKEAMTDGLKRALRQFGNALGNCLYDKEFLKQIQNVKSEPVPMDESRLFRRTTANTTLETRVQPSNIYERPVQSVGDGSVSHVEGQPQRQGPLAGAPRTTRPAGRQQRAHRRDSRDDDSFVFSDDVVALNELDNTANPTVRPALPDSDPEFDDELTPAELTKLDAAYATMSTQQEKEKPPIESGPITETTKNTTIPSEITFVSATSADRITEDPSLLKSMKYDTSYQGKNANRSILDQNKSAPIKRTEIRTEIRTADILATNENIPVEAAKRTFGLPVDRLPNKRLHK